MRTKHTQEQVDATMSKIDQELIDNPDTFEIFATEDGTVHYKVNGDGKGITWNQAREFGERLIMIANKAKRNEFEYLGHNMVDTEGGTKFI